MGFHAKTQRKLNGSQIVAPAQQQHNRENDKNTFKTN
jgi:hypothetical protein